MARQSSNKGLDNSLVDANGITLECPPFADGKIKVPPGKPSYDGQDTPREEQPLSELYLNIKTKLAEFYNNLRLNLTNICRHIPR